MLFNPSADLLSPTVVPVNCHLCLQFLIPQLYTIQQC